MAVESIRVSDLSQVPIPPGTGARVRIAFYGDRVDMRADLTDAEVDKLAKQFKFREVETRPYRAGEKRRKG